MVCVGDYNFFPVLWTLAYTDLRTLTTVGLDTIDIFYFPFHHVYFCTVDNFFRWTDCLPLQHNTQHIHFIPIIFLPTADNFFLSVRGR